jgi:hypothetical protein
MPSNEQQPDSVGAPSGDSSGSAVHSMGTPLVDRWMYVYRAATAEAPVIPAGGRETQSKMDSRPGVCDARAVVRLLGRELRRRCSIRSVVA